MEFEIPEPGAWTRWLHQNDQARNMINKPPLPLTVDGNPVTAANPVLKPSDISDYPGDRNDYRIFAARYMASGFSAAPGPLTISVNLGASNDVKTDAPQIKVGNQSDTSVAVPNGYVVVNGTDEGGNPINGWTASLMYVGTDAISHIDVAVGGGHPVRSAPTDAAPDPGTAIRDQDSLRDQIQGVVGPISQGNVPVAIQVVLCWGFEVNVEINCVPLQQTFEQWQNDTYDLIVAAYNTMLQAYRDELAGLDVQQTNLVDANSPDQNALTITQELKRQIIEMLGVTTTSAIPPPPPPNFFGLNGIVWDPAGVSAPYNTLNDTTVLLFAQTIQFLEQAFEWETLSYICYPYYWADSSRWPDLVVIQGNDQNFADFLRAGSARVVLAARPGFENQVNLFVQYGILWGAGPMPAPGDPDYLSIADEIKEMQQRPTDVTVIDTWQVRLPTTLIWLQNKNLEGQLPNSLNPTIDTTPKIVALSPAAGSVGDSVTISGRNFGDIQGTSTVSFNGTAATPTNWSARSIDVTVPAGAAPGNVVVTVRSVGGDGVTINSVPSNGLNFMVN